MHQAVTDLFDLYARQTNAALAGTPDLLAIADLYADSFLGAAPAGIMTGTKDDAFLTALAAGFDRYRAIGTRKMEVRRLAVEPIDAQHALARVDWRATYAVAGGTKAIDFTNTYLVRIDEGRARVFGWITGDENAELRRQGIID